MTQNSVKPIFLFIFFFLVISASNITHAQTNMGIRAGMNFSNVLMEDENGEKNSTKSIPGFHFGLTVDIPIADDFYLQPAVLYSKKRFKQTDSWFSGSGNELKVNVSYIEVPFNFIYKPKLGNGKLLIGAGPYAGYGIGGSWKSETDVVIGDIIIENYGDVIFRNDVTDGEFGNYLYGKPWDFGANFLVGYEFFERLSIQFNIQIGVKDLQSDVDGVKREGEIKNRGYGISVGYKF